MWDVESVAPTSEAVMWLGEPVARGIRAKLARGPGGGGAVRPVDRLGAVRGLVRRIDGLGVAAEVLENPFNDRRRLGKSQSLTISKRCTRSRHACPS